MTRSRLRRSRTHTARDNPRSTVFLDDSPETPGYGVKWKGEKLPERHLSFRTARAHLDALHINEKETTKEDENAA